MKNREVMVALVAVAAVMMKVVMDEKAPTISLIDTLLQSPDYTSPIRLSYISSLLPAFRLRPTSTPAVLLLGLFLALSPGGLGFPFLPPPAPAPYGVFFLNIRVATHPFHLHLPYPIFPLIPFPAPSSSPHFPLDFVF